MNIRLCEGELTEPHAPLFGKDCISSSTRRRKRVAQTMCGIRREEGGREKGRERARCTADRAHA